MYVVLIIKILSNNIADEWIVFGLRATVSSVGNKHQIKCSFCILSGQFTGAFRYRVSSQQGGSGFLLGQVAFSVGLEFIMHFMKLLRGYIQSVGPR